MVSVTDFENFTDEDYERIYSHYFEDLIPTVMKGVIKLELEYEEFGVSRGRELWLCLRQVLGIIVSETGKEELKFDHYEHLNLTEEQRKEVIEMDLHEEISDFLDADDTWYGKVYSSSTMRRKCHIEEKPPSWSGRMTNIHSEMKKALRLVKKFRSDVGRDNLNEALPSA